MDEKKQIQEIRIEFSSIDELILLDTLNPQMSESDVGKLVVGSDSKLFAGSDS